MKNEKNKIMGKYFNVRFKPDLVNGTVANLIDSDKSDNQFSNADVLFDWHTLELPQACKLSSVTVVVMGKNGAAQGNVNMELLFARAVDGVAPTSIGTVNATASCLNLNHHIVGVVTMDGDKGAFGTDNCYVLSSAVGSADGGHAQIVLEGEHSTTSGYKTGYQTIYVAAITRGALDLITGVRTDAFSDGASADITVDTKDPRLSISPGDILYIHDVDTSIGTVKSVPDSTSIILTTTNVGAIANDDEIVNATPLKFTLHCEI